MVEFISEFFLFCTILLYISILFALSIKNSKLLFSMRKEQNLSEETKALTSLAILSLFNPITNILVSMYIANKLKKVSFFQTNKNFLNQHSGELSFVLISSIPVIGILYAYNKAKYSLQNFEEDLINEKSVNSLEKIIRNDGLFKEELAECVNLIDDVISHENFKNLNTEEKYNVFEKYEKILIELSKVSSDSYAEETKKLIDKIRTELKSILQELNKHEFENSLKEIKLRFMNVSKGAYCEDLNNKLKNIAATDINLLSSEDVHHLTYSIPKKISNLKTKFIYNISPENLPLNLYDDFKDFKSEYSKVLLEIERLEFRINKNKELQDKIIIEKAKNLL